VYVALFFTARSAYLLRQLQPSRYLKNRHLVTPVTLITKFRCKRWITGNSSYCEHVRKLITEHPLISHKLTALRDERTDSPTFRRLADELVMLLAYEATRSIRVEAVTVQTPVAAAQGVRLAAPTPVVIPILRAGLGMLDGMTRLLPTAEVGFLGMVRDHDTLQPTTYADRIPGDLKGRQVFLLDPMLATGGTLIAAIDLMLDRGANQITAICLLSAPEGIAAVEAALAGRDVDVTLVTAAVDEKLNEKGYIVPGLGDAGDRLFGVV
jgi:uracil phosphoribosyltransferase